MNDIYNLKKKLKEKKFATSDLGKKYILFQFVKRVCYYNIRLRSIEFVLLYRCLRVLERDNSV